MGEFSNSGMIALLPSASSWFQVKLPHLTLAYLGEIDRLSPSVRNEATKAILTIGHSFPPVTVPLVARELLGPEAPVDALVFQPNDALLEIRKRVEEWNVSDYVFKPHVTIGDQGVSIVDAPEFLTFNRILLSWGDDNVSFKLDGDVLNPPW